LKFSIVIFFVVYLNDCETLNQKISNLSEREVRKSYTFLYQECPQTALSIPCFLPLNDFDGVNISSGFGNRKHPLKGIIKHHIGINLASPIQEVITTASGVVLKTGFENGLGSFVVIDHKNSYQTTYGHLSKILAIKGQKVMITETIGMVGSTGASTGNHVHYEIRKNGVLCNPVGYLLLLFYSVYR
jgi:murein DD-endopeptidase MepM/ murein hydrolase activator NlpD